MIVCGPYILQNRRLYWGDIDLYFRPILTLLHESLLRGKLRLWNDRMLCGTTYVGNPQTWTFYPFSALLIVMSADRFIGVSNAFHMFVAALGVFCFTRRNYGVSASCLAAIVYAFGGTVASKVQFPNMLQAMAYVPWILVALRTHLRYCTIRSWSVLAGALGLQLLCAHAQVVMLTWYLAVVYGVWLIRVEQTCIKPFKLCGTVLCAGLAAVLLALVQILPTVEFVLQSARQQLTLHEVNRFYLPVTQLLNFVLPNIHGHPIYGNWTARGNYWETCCYVGIVPSVIIIAGLAKDFHRGRLRIAVPWLILMVVSLWLALGAKGGLFILAYHFLPGVNRFHDPARFLLWFAFAASQVTAHGFDVLFTAPRRSLRLIGVVAAIFVASVWDLARFDNMLYPTVPIDTAVVLGPVGQRLHTDPEIMDGQARILSPDSKRIWSRFTTYRSFRQHNAAYMELWHETQAPNLPVSVGLSDAWGYEPLMYQNIALSLGQNINEYWGLTPSGQQIFNDKSLSDFSVKYVVLNRQRLPKNIDPTFSLIASSVSINSIRSDGSSADTVWLLRNNRFIPVVSVANNHSKSMARSKNHIASVDNSVPNQITVDCGSNSPADLIVRTNLSNSWNVVVNDRPSKINPISPFGGIIEIPAKPNDVVRLRYAPESFQFGLFVSLFVLSFLIAIVTSTQFCERTVKQNRLEGQP